MAKAKTVTMARNPGGRDKFGTVQPPFIEGAYPLSKAKVIEVLERYGFRGTYNPDRWTMHSGYIQKGGSFIFGAEEAVIRGKSACLAYELWADSKGIPSEDAIDWLHKVAEAWTQVRIDLGGKDNCRILLSPEHRKEFGAIIVFGNTLAKWPCKRVRK